MKTTPRAPDSRVELARAHLVLLHRRHELALVVARGEDQSCSRARASRGTSARSTADRPAARRRANRCSSARPARPSHVRHVSAASNLRTVPGMIPRPPRPPTPRSRRTAAADPGTRPERLPRRGNSAGVTSPRCFRMSIALPYAPTPGKPSLSAAMTSSAVVTSFTVTSLMMALRTGARSLPRLRSVTSPLDAATLSGRRATTRRAPAGGAREGVGARREERARGGGHRHRARRGRRPAGTRVATRRMDASINAETLNPVWLTRKLLSFRSTSSIGAPGSAFTSPARI